MIAAFRRAGRIVVAFATVASFYAVAGRAEEPPQYQPAGMFNQHLYAGTMVRPRAVAFDAKHDEVVVGDGGSGRIGIFRPDGVELYSFLAREPDRDIARIGITPNGAIAVTGGSRSSIETYSYRGVYKGPLQLDPAIGKPVIGAFTWDSSGNLYVGDNGSAQVLVLGRDGKLRQQFGSRGSEEGQFEAISDIEVDREGRIWVLDHRALAVQLFDSQGNFLRGWGRHETGAENFSLPSGLAISSTGQVLVTDELRHVVKLFTQDGKFLGHFGGLGDGRGQLSFPSDIAIGSGDRIWVSERGTARIQSFALATKR